MFPSRTRSIATSPGHQESGNASSHPNRTHQLALVMQPPSIQQIQSMAAVNAKLTRQNQELTREIYWKNTCLSHTKHMRQKINGSTSFTIDNVYHVIFKI